MTSTHGSSRAIHSARIAANAILLLLCVVPPFLGSRARGEPAQPWAGAAVADWKKAAQAIVISDMSRCQPRAALFEMTLKRKCWKLIPYRMVDAYEGKMIFAPPEADAPELSLTLEAEGWFAVFVGLFSAPEVPTKAWIRLDTDPAPVPRFNGRGDHYGNSEEVFFRVVRLQKDSRLLVSPQNTGDVSACGITHVKLIPLAEAEVHEIEADRRDRSHRALAATNDGFSDMFYRSPRTASSLLSQVEIFRDTDFGTLILQSPGADKVGYPSGVGFMKGSESEVFPRVGDRHFVEAIRALAEQKINPVKVLTDRAHEIGMQVHVGNRPAGWSFFEPYTDYWESPFYRDHPQWRCEDRDGTPVTRMSWAVPEVRKHLVDLLREQVQFGADGVNLVFTRGYPLVLYEPPAVDLFQKQYHADPRQVPESDPRITAFRSDVVTNFFQELRAMLDLEHERRGKGKRLALCVLISGSAEEDRDDLAYGVDLRRLITQKLVDEVFTEHGFGATNKKFNLDFLREVCRPANVPFSPGIYSDAQRFSEVPTFYQHGARGVTVWDAEVRDMFEWCWMSRFGHVDETNWRLKNLNLKKAPRTIYSFQKLGDQIRNGRFGPHWGG